jgi:autotransporter-associated beta strand protein/T5SS/PEP-CTERM-associated repeat protein
LQISSALYNGYGVFSVSQLNITTGGIVSTSALKGGNSTSSVNFNGGTLQITSTSSSSNAINLLAGGGTLDVPNASTALTITSAISGVGSLNKTGAGKLILTGANTYAGPTIVDGGTLLVSNTTGSGTGAGGATVNSTATLGGTGTIAGSINVAAGGTLSPGASIGTLATGAVLFQDSTSVLALELNLGATPAADLLSVTGSVTLSNSVLSLSLSNAPDPLSFGAPKTFLILSNDADDPVSGLFGSIAGLPSGYTATADYAYIGTDAVGRTGDGNDIAITISAVPEPASGSLFLSAIAAMIWVANRDKGGSGFTIRRGRQIGIVLILAIGAPSADSAITITGSTSPVYDNSDPWSVSSLNVGTTAGPGTIAITAGSALNNSGQSIIAGSAAASNSSVTVDGIGSTWTNGGAVYVGQFTQHGAATLTISGGGSVSCNGALIGSFSNCAMTITDGGTMTDTAAVVSGQANGAGAVYVGGGTGTSIWSNSALQIGTYGAGAATITSGGNVSVQSTGYSLTVGGMGPGTLTIDGGSLSCAGNAQIGGYQIGSTGTLSITDGGSMTNALAFIGGGIGTGTVYVGGGTGTSVWSTSNQLTIGYQGSGAVSVTRGGKITAGTAYSTSGTALDVQGNNGIDPGGTLTIAGGSVWCNSSMGIASISGTMTITDGGSMTDWSAAVPDSFSVNTATVSVGGGSGTSVWSNSYLLIGGDGHGGTVTITGGGKVLVSNNLNVGGSSTGTLTITGGGSVLCNGGTSISYYGTVNVGGGDATSFLTTAGLLSFHGGALNVTSGGLVSAAGIYNDDTHSSISIDGGTLQVTATSAGNTPPVNLLAGGGTLDVPNASTALKLTSGISGAGGFHKTGAGKLILTAANTYAGPTIVDGGTVLANNTTGSATGAGAVTVNNTATLGGTGIIAGSVSVAAGGTLAPGASIGTLATGAISLQDSTSALAVELNLGATPAADLLNVTGTVSLNNSILSLSLSNAPDPLLFGPPKTFLVLANDADDPVSSAFGSIAGLPSGYNATADYAYIGTDALGRAGDGNDIAITISAVPEPSSLVLVAIGLSATAATRSRQAARLRP